MGLRALQREAALKDAARKLEDRLTVDERSEILREFWTSIDKGIEEGDLPAP